MVFGRRLAAALACWSVGGATGALAGQARPPLAVAQDTSGVLSAIRAIDLRQLCRCRTVQLDSTVRTDPKIGLFEVLYGRSVGVLSAVETARLNLAGKRVVRTALRSIHDATAGTVLMAVQHVPTPSPRRRILVVVTPPSKITTAYLVTLIPRRTAWAVEGVRAVYDP